MPFPISYHGTLSWHLDPEKYKSNFPNNSIESLKGIIVAEIAKGLEKVQGRDVLIQGKNVTFRGGIFRLEQFSVQCRT